MNAAVGLLVLAAVLGFAVARPRGLPEAVSAVPGAGLLVALGLVSRPQVHGELVALGPTVGFLAAVLVLGTSPTSTVSATPERSSAVPAGAHHGGCCGCSSYSPRSGPPC
ncbi:hypothetical protein [Micromonospora sp. DT47]|uniref:hypothetical protein n=1 Tax=Micromonospora sp. DT47 TaxID=3393431 RepID=UPI003CEE66EC